MIGDLGAGELEGERAGEARTNEQAAFQLLLHVWPELLFGRGQQHGSTDDTLRLLLHNAHSLEEEGGLLAVKLHSLRTTEHHYERQIARLDERLATTRAFFARCPYRYPYRYPCMKLTYTCLLYTSPSPRDATLSRMPSSA